LTSERITKNSVASTFTVGTALFLIKKKGGSAMGNDFRRLKQEADIASVIDALGIPVSKKGSASFIHCPNPGHNDHHATNAFFYKVKNHVYCAVCGKRFYAIDIIMWQTGRNYGDAADYLWQLEGCPSWYRDKEWRTKKEHFAISTAEANLIGLKLPSVVASPVRQAEHREALSRELPNDYRYDGTLLEQTEYQTWTDYLSEAQLKPLVRAHCRQELKRLAHMEEMVGTPIPSMAERKAKITELLNRALA
jgi:hypothetical protein